MGVMTLPFQGYCGPSGRGEGQRGASSPGVDPTQQDFRLMRFGGAELATVTLPPLTLPFPNPVLSLAFLRVEWLSQNHTSGVPSPPRHLPRTCEQVALMRY